MMQALSAELVLACSNALGEGPVWDDRLQELFWVDIEGRKLQRYNPASGSKQDYEFDRKIGAAVPATDGSWILAMQDGFYRFDLQGQPELIVSTPEEDIMNRMNDGKCDRAGRFWAGTISSKNAPDASLFVLEAGGKLEKRFSNVICSNGMAWNGDNTLYYYIDTGQAAVFVFDYDAETGSISNHRTAISFRERGEQGMPDGMCIDEEGMLWISHWGGWQVSRWNPLTGEKLAKIEVPVKNVTSCTFGGNELDELYITTARIGNNEEDLAGQPLAGGVFRAKPGVRGLPVDRARI